MSEDIILPIVCIAGMFVAAIACNAEIYKDTLWDWNVGSIAGFSIAAVAAILGAVRAIF